MASKNIKFRRRFATGVETLNVETKVEQLQKSEGVPIDEELQWLAKRVNPGSPGYFYINPGTGIGIEMTPGIIGGIASVHTHTIAQITGLQDLLDGKVPLVNGKVPAQYWPENAKGQMRFCTAIALTGETQISLDTIYANYLDTEVSGDLNVGHYVVINTAGRINVGATGNFYLLGSDEDEGSTPYLEVGDWIIFVKYDDVSVPGTPKYYFSITNNVYVGASQAKDGIIKLGPSGITHRYELATTQDNAKVITEGSLRTVLKDIRLVTGQDAKYTFYETSDSVYNASANKWDLTVAGGGSVVPYPPTPAQIFTVLYAKYPSYSGTLDTVWTNVSGDAVAKVDYSGGGSGYYKFDIEGVLGDLFFEE